MLATIGITVFASLLNFLNLISSFETEENGMVENLAEVFSEIAKVPTGTEFLYALEGHMTALDFLARQAGDSFYQDFDHFKDRYQSYRAEPNFDNATPLLTDIIALIQNPAIKHSYDYVEACLLGTQHVLTQVNSDFNTWTHFECLQILGEISMLDNFNDHLTVDAIDTEFENLLENFIAFLTTPTLDTHSKVIRTLEDLITLLQKEKDKKVLSEEKVPA
jgi:hypothetical protein